MEERPFQEQEPAADSGAETEEAGAELDRKNDEIKALHEKVLRAYAELENFKKRAAREKSDWVRYSNEGLLRDLVGVLDNLERARHYGGKNPEIDRWAEGVSLTIKHFEEILAKAGVRPIKALGEKFDPAVHQAMAQVDAEGEPGRVVDEHQRGYLLHDRVLRPSMVTVSRKKESAESESEGGTNG
jgi:molecular chaperone GrpE